MSAQTPMSLTWLPTAPPPLTTGLIKAMPEEFVVGESLSFELSGEGTHHYLLLRKTGANTEWVARQLARFAEVSGRVVGYAGRKDRQAVTDQWFSVELPARRELDWNTLNLPGVELLKHQRHGRKLRIGALRENHFQLVIREADGDWQQLERRLEQIMESGIPNYFGPQRFGHQGRNLAKAEALFTRKLRLKRKDAGLYYSAARSALFNDVLARRVQQGNWNQGISGDVLMLDGSHSHFTIEQPDEQTIARIESGDLHPTGPLHGRGESAVQLECLGLEEEAMAARPALKSGLEQARLDPDRRALRVRPRHLTWQQHDNQLRLAFSLPAGSYATALLAELVENIRQPDHFEETGAP
ncbi:MAG: tRNA pseudouridine(13) synthase TruD [Gammaproteobacteria bacterium]|nr:tRNA pseudouridine(13) synthase TruD [Gammaproteobacteria bacterium]